MRGQTRRTFLRKALAATWGGGLWAISGTKSSGRILGANDRIRVAVAGLNGRGGSHVAELLGLAGVEIAYLVDPDQRTWAGRLSQIGDQGGRPPQTVQDVRRALDDAELNAVTIATPNHWHALMTAWALQADKDVYVEKPCSHNVREGRVISELARQRGRIVQHGTQKRSDPQWAGVMEFLHSGQAGKLLVSRGLCYKPRSSIGFAQPQTPPAELDFNLWLGPAPEQPFHTNLVHYNWHWFWDTGNGDIGNQGVHEMDVARWAIADATLPRSALSLGGRFGYVDQGQTANTQVAAFDFGETWLVFETRGLPTDGLRGQKVGNIFHCEGGDIVGAQFFPRGSDQGQPIASGVVGPGGGHFGNFIEAVRSRRSADLNAEVLQGHYSSALCHLANVSLRLGTQAPVQEAPGQLLDAPAAAEAYERLQQHLRDNGVDLAQTQQTVGRFLQIDAQQESFVNDSAADALLTRDYRQGFEMPTI